MAALLSLLTVSALLLIPATASAVDQPKTLADIWICSDDQGEAVFTNLPYQYQACEQYVPQEQDLRELFLEHILNQQNERDAIEQIQRRHSPPAKGPVI